MKVCEECYEYLWPAWIGIGEIKPETFFQIALDRGFCDLTQDVVPADCIACEHFREAN